MQGLVVTFRRLFDVLRGIKPEPMGCTLELYIYVVRAAKHFISGLTETGNSFATLVSMKYISNQYFNSVLRRRDQSL